MEQLNLDPGWRKSSYSGNAGSANCVETAARAGTVVVRDTANRDGGTLEFPAAAWSAFLATVR